MISPIEESEPHLVAIGRIAARWATLDGVLSVALGLFIGNLNAGHDLYHSAVSTSARFDMLSASLRTAKMNPAKRDEISRLIDNLRGLWKRRNFLMHNPIASGSQENVERFVIIHNAPLRKAHLQFHPVTLKELNEHADRVAEVGDRLFYLTRPPVAKMPAR